MAQLTKQIFCAKCQAVTAQSGAVDLNGEYVFTCTICGGFIKLPAKMSKEEIVTHLEAHAADNIGQVSIAESEATLNDFMAS